MWRHFHKPENMMMKRSLLIAAICAGALPALSVSAQAERTEKSLKQVGKSPLKVFILAGQSNMQGQGIVTSVPEGGVEKPGTLASMLKDPVKGPLLKTWVNAKGEWKEDRDDVWV